MDTEHMFTNYQTCVIGPKYLWKREVRTFTCLSLRKTIVTGQENLYQPIESSVGKALPDIFVYSINVHDCIWNANF